MNLSTAIDDQLWAALGDPTRRQVMDRLVTEGPATASILGRELPVTRQAIAKHLVVLESAGLVKAATIGRELRYGIDERQLARAVGQLNAVSEAWDRRLQRIRSIAESLQQEIVQEAAKSPSKTDAE